MKEKIITISAEDTQRVGHMLAGRILNAPMTDHAVIVHLQGGLGSGKTTWMQGFARALGATTNVTSPTFVLERRIPLTGSRFMTLHHFDWYRLSDRKEIEELGFKDIVKNPEAVIAIEWPDAVQDSIAQADWVVSFVPINEQGREITITQRV